MRSQSGWAFIEVMIVVAILGILATVAIPAYNDWKVREPMKKELQKIAISFEKGKDPCAAPWRSKEPLGTLSCKKIPEEPCKETHESIVLSLYDSPPPIDEKHLVATLTRFSDGTMKLARF